MALDPAAADPELLRSVELEEVPPEAAEPCTLVEDELLGLEEPEDDEGPCGQVQFSAGLLVEVEPETPDWVEPLVVELVLPLTDGELVVLLVPPAALLEGVVLPLAEVEPDALPAPEDWLVCAPWFIVEDGFVVVALWLAVAPLEELTLPEPMFTSGLMLAPAFTSVLLMPTFASTPTLGLTFVLLDEPLAALGCEVLGCEPEDWLVCADWSVDEDDVCAKAGPNAPITAAAVILTAKFRSLILSLLG